MSEISNKIQDVLLLLRRLVLWQNVGAFHEFRSQCSNVALKKVCICIYTIWKIFFVSFFMLFWLINNDERGKWWKMIYYYFVNIIIFNSLLPSDDIIQAIASESRSTCEIGHGTNLEFTYIFHVGLEYQVRRAKFLIAQKSVKSVIIILIYTFFLSYYDLSQQIIFIYQYCYLNWKFKFAMEISIFHFWVP